VAPHEKLFIRTHQAMEIWFDQMNDELEYARTVLSQPRVAESEVSDVARHVARCTTITALLTEHMEVLETLSSIDFFDFRQNLFGAAGFDSFRFREFEWLAGLIDNGYLAYASERAPHFAGGEEFEATAVRYQSFWHRRMETVVDPSTAILKGRDRTLSDSSVRALIMTWLERTPYPDPAGGAPSPTHRDTFVALYRGRFEEAFRRDLEQARGADPGGPGAGRSSHDDADVAQALARLDWFVSSPARCAMLFILQYAHLPLLTWPKELLEGVLTLDQGIITWRGRHIEMVSHVLGGGRLSTGGQKGSGLTYLRQTMLLRIFPETSDARSFLLGHREASGLYEAAAWQPFQLGTSL
jgi:tryptophan 2,3-dioxygenase